MTGIRAVPPLGAAPAAAALEAIDAPVSGNHFVTHLSYQLANED